MLFCLSGDAPVNELLLTFISVLQYFGKHVNNLIFENQTEPT